MHFEREADLRGYRALGVKAIIVSMAVTEGIDYVAGKKEDGLPLSLIDIRGDYFYALAKSENFIRLPLGDHEEGTRGYFMQSTRGTGDAASNWEYGYMEFLTKFGFAPCVRPR